MDADQITLFQLEEYQEKVISLSEHIEPVADVREYEILAFEIGDRVKIQNVAEEESDPESFFYLKDFEGKRGTISKVIEKPVLQYEVTFGERIAIVYHHELSIGWPK